MKQILSEFSNCFKITIFGEGLKINEDQHTNIKQNYEECSICFQIVPINHYTSKCQHCFCKACILKWIATGFFNNKLTRTCPNCRSGIEEDIIAFEFEIDNSIFYTQRLKDFIKLLKYQIMENFDIDEKIWINYIVPKNASDSEKFRIKTHFESLMLQYEKNSLKM